MAKGAMTIEDLVTLMKGEFDEMSKRFEQVDKRFDSGQEKIDHRFQEIHQIIDRESEKNSENYLNIFNLLIEQKGKIEDIRTRLVKLEKRTFEDTEAIVNDILGLKKQLEFVKKKINRLQLLAV